MMKTILVMAFPNDYHTLAVQWGIEQLGGIVKIWVPGDLPDMASISISIVEGDTHVRFVSGAEDFNCDDVGVVWNRRYSIPVAPEDASPHDRPAIQRESYEQVRSAIFTTSQEAIAINDPSAQYAADRKAVQVRTASIVGFTVPPTLFSNNYEDILEFHRKHGPLIAKPHHQYAWVTPNGTLSHLTFELPEPTESLRKSIEYCPLIIQKKVERAFEARLIMMGDTITAAKMIDLSTEGILDSRKAMCSGAMEFSLIDPPSEVAKLCGKYMAALGLRMGVFDFIVDASGVWYFLECNEQGQFLFVEQVLPEAALLDKFCRWLMELAGADRHSLDRHPRLVLKSFEQSDRTAELRAEQEKHKRLPDPPQVIRETV